MKIYHISTSARITVEEFCADELAAQQEWEERVERCAEGLREYRLHCVPNYWFCQSWEDLVDKSIITPETIDGFEAEIAAKRAEEEAWREDALKTLRELDEYMMNNPWNDEVADFYSDFYKEVHGFRPRARLNAWWEMSHEEEGE